MRDVGVKGNHLHYLPLASIFAPSASEPHGFCSLLRTPRRVKEFNYSYTFGTLIRYFVI